MNYLPPFEVIKGFMRFATVRGEVRVDASYEDFQRLIRTVLAGIDVDEEWYLHTYDDVAQGIGKGLIVSARQHFIDHGYFEGRRPFPISVDERWYLATNSDVADEVRRGTFDSGQGHFDAAGYREGRRPRAL
ncbi:MAG TPA: hypothetical protein VGG99_10935 [Acetobacteraceae bacterium]